MTRIRELVKPDRVHRSVYLDESIFEMEMERIYARAWIYVGHASQVPEPGDFLTTRIGRQPVVLSRHEDGEIYVLFNRCGHRGAVVCNEPHGNARHFRCCYHGWTFHLNGLIKAIPLQAGYPRDVDLDDPSLGMVRVPRTDTHRGFVFASLAPEGPTLAEYLGPMTGKIDDICDRSPAGEVEVTGGVHRYEFPGNWKAQMENLNDLYHVPHSHESTTSGGRQFRRTGTATGSRLTREDGSPISFWDRTGVWAFDGGHSYCGRMPDAGPVSREEHPDYVAALEARLGPERAAEVLDADWHNAIIYPNLGLQSMAQHIRVIRPISVDRTEVLVYPMKLRDAPDVLNRTVIRYLNVTHAAASLIQTDDLEAFGRLQRGLPADGSEWVFLGRGLGAEQPLEDDFGYRSEGTHELPLRNQYREWLSYMGEGAN